MAAGGDAVQVAPHVYTVVFENKRVRVLDILLKPGAKSAIHTHPEYVLYAITPTKVKFTNEAGTATEVEFPAGATWRDAEAHAVENIGSADAHAIAIELK